MFGEDLFQCVTNRVFLEKDHNLTEENIIKARLVKGSIAGFQAANPTSHFSSHTTDTRHDFYDFCIAYLIKSLANDLKAI